MDGSGGRDPLRFIAGGRLNPFSFKNPLTTERLPFNCKPASGEDALLNIVAMSRSVGTNTNPNKDDATTLMKSGRASFQDLVSLFSEFDPTNTQYSYPVWDRTQYAITLNSALELELLATHMNKPWFRRDRLLSPRSLDELVFTTAVMNALASMILVWDTETCRLAQGNVTQLVDIVRGISYAEDGCYCYAYTMSDGRVVPFIKTAVKCFSKLFNHETPSLPSPTFDLLRTLSATDFQEHLRLVYKELVAANTEGYNAGVSDFMLDLAKSCAQEYVRGTSPLLNALDNAGGFYALSTAEPPHAFYVTGQACCGKTTLLETFCKWGWKTVSRGSLGSFAGKSANPMAVSSLYQALEFVLAHPTSGHMLMGDRGQLDNPLWVVIMDIMDPKRAPQQVVSRMLDMFHWCINEPVAAQFVRSRVAIFIDPLPRENAKRMLQRGEGGDCFRSRIQNYPVAQAIAYYACARLFGWPVFFVPYCRDDDGNGWIMDRVEMEKYIHRVSDYFELTGHGAACPPLNCFRFARPGSHTGQGLVTPKLDFAKSVGIFK